MNKLFNGPFQSLRAFPQSKTYKPKEKCKYGHESERYEKNNRCVQCAKMTNYINSESEGTIGPQYNKMIKEIQGKNHRRLAIEEHQHRFDVPDKVIPLQNAVSLFGLID